MDFLVVACWAQRARRSSAGAWQGEPRAFRRRIAATSEYFSAPTLEFGDAALQSSLGAPYSAALADLIDVNTVDADRSVYNSSGADQLSARSVRGGRGGVQAAPALDTGQRGQLLERHQPARPGGRANTLWAATTRQSDGSLILLQDTQWWDHIIWVAAAGNHYAISGDRDFLANAYETSVNSLAARRTNNFNDGYGLFEGPGFMNDGIAGYPVPPDSLTGRSGFVLSYPGAADMMVLSTTASTTAHTSHWPAWPGSWAGTDEAATYQSAGNALRKAINHHLWREDAGTYGYFIHGSDSLAGQLDTSQEGGGLAFAVLFGVANPSQIGRLLTNTHWQPHGVVNVWSHFSRYNDEMPGRHNVMVWPMVHSMFGHAAAAGGRVDLFGRAVTKLANLVTGIDGHFYELYNSITGARDGGWQVNRHWTSQPDQTWSATGYLRMIYSGLFGLSFAPEGLTIAPTLPPGWGPVSLKGLRYRDMTLDIELSGAGNQVRFCTVDGRPSRPTVSADGHGTRTVRIRLGGGSA